MPGFIRTLLLCASLITSACATSGEVSSVSADYATVRMIEGMHTPAAAQLRAAELCGSKGREALFLERTTERYSLSRRIVRYDFLCR